MPFSHIPKIPGDLIKSDDWNTALNAIVQLFGKFDNAAGHLHSGVGEDAPPINEAGIANNAISAAKIQAGTITADKVVANAFSRNIGISFVLTLSNGQTIPPPSGFIAQECVFFVSATSANTTNGEAWSYTVKVNGAGVVTIIKSANMNISVSGLALAKKGGW